LFSSQLFPRNLLSQQPRTAAIKDFWEKVGLKTNVKLVEFGKYNEDLANQK
jgi:uncharacterized protein with GYD domain